MSGAGADLSTDLSADLGTGPRGQRQAAAPSTGSASSCENEPPVFPRLFRLHHMVMRVGDRLTGPLGLTSSRWMMLCAIGKKAEPQTVGALSEELRLSPQNVSRMVGSMESEGLVERVTNLGPGRTTHVRLTEAGRVARERLEVLGEGFINQILRGVDADEVAALEAVLERLIENTMAYEADLIDGNAENADGMA